MRENLRYFYGFFLRFRGKSTPEGSQEKFRLFVCLNSATSMRENLRDFDGVFPSFSGQKYPRTIVGKVPFFCQRSGTHKRLIGVSTAEQLRQKFRICFAKELVQIIVKIIVILTVYLAFSGFLFGPQDPVMAG